MKAITDSRVVGASRTALSDRLLHGCFAVHKMHCDSLCPHLDVQAWLTVAVSLMSSRPQRNSAHVMHAALQRFSSAGPLLVTRSRKYGRDGLARDRRRLTLLLFLSALYAAIKP
jgi:hypothetical protein